MIELKVAAQIFFHRAAARCSAKTDKSDGGSVGLSVGRLLHSLVTGVLRVEAGEAGAGVARSRRLTEGESGDKTHVVICSQILFRGCAGLDVEVYKL